MAFPRRSANHRLNAPKVVTFSLSLLLVLLAVASLYIHIPAVGAQIAAHRFWILLAGYGLLAAGCVLTGL